jgi:type I restriction enzyme R subunit
MTTDTSEAGLESLIVSQMVGCGWIEGDPHDYEREFAVDLEQLAAFLETTQPKLAEAVAIREDGPTRRKFLSRLQGEITKRGAVDVLRNGIQTGPHDVTLFYATPSPGNVAAAELYAQNRFVVSRQLRYSADETQLALDLVLFINGLPVATFELKNQLTKQTYEDAIEQYKTDRNPRELIFGLGRCIAHFAVDDDQAYFCTHLKGKSSWFLPFNRGFNHGAGNPPNPDGVKTDYLWREVLAPESLTDIVESYAALITTKDPKTGRKRQTQLFPRYHQLDVVRKLLADAAERGAGRRYLIQHSAGSGKSNSIAWLAHGLVELERDGATVFDSIVVVTDRRILDRQIEATVKQFAQVSATVGHAEHSGDLRRFIESGKKIIISTVQKFPFILDEIGSEHAGRRVAIVIDEAHSSQGGETAKAMSQALSGENVDRAEDYEDQINRVIESRRLLPNASYFAFTATPKRKTLELFGDPVPEENGKTAHRPFHSYTMKQAIQERFIVDVLESYTPIPSYYKLMRTIEEDPEFDVKKASAKLRRFVEGHEHAVHLKAEIMVDHFHADVLAKRKINGEARAMVVTSSIARALDYFFAIRDYLKERRSTAQAIVAFSGEHDYKGHRVSEASLNQFPSREIPEKIRQIPYRILVCADKFQTGYDEPLMHTMYVDKPLAGVQAVQTLSRLNRAHPAKYDAFVLDFTNNAETIEAAFADYYRTTLLSGETDPDKLHDLSAALYAAEVFTAEDVRELVRLFLAGAPVVELHPILDACVATYNSDLEEDEQVEFKGSAKAFVRSYGFLSQILPWSKAEWEELAIFLQQLIPKLPAPKEDDLSRGILETVDIESYRAEKLEARKIALPDEDAAIEPMPPGGVGGKPEPEMDRLSNIIKAFNHMFGDIEWEDRDRVERILTQELPAKVRSDSKYRNAMANSDRQNARIEHDAALARAMQSFLTDDTQLYKQFSDNEDFKRWLTETIFVETYEPGDRGEQQALVVD